MADMELSALWHVPMNKGERNLSLESSTIDWKGTDTEVEPSQCAWEGMRCTRTHVVPGQWPTAVRGVRQRNTHRDLARRTRNMEYTPPTHTANLVPSLSLSTWTIKLVE